MELETDDTHMGLRRWTWMRSKHKLTIRPWGPDRELN